MALVTRKTITTAQAIHQLNRLDDEQLGAYLREYINESEHNNWDGWENYEKHVARKVIKDMAIGSIIFEQLVEAGV